MRRLAKILPCLVVFFLLTAGWALAAGDSIVIKVRDVGQVMAMAEDLLSGMGQPGGPDVGAQVKQMLGQLDWIDNRRSVVAQVDLSGDKPQVFAMVPFTRQNDEFQRNFNAAAGKDFYVLSWPPGLAVPKPALVQLNSASRKKGEDLISVDLPMAELMAVAKPFMEKGMAQAQQQTQDPQQQMNLEMAQKMMGSFGEMLDQIRILSLGFDANGQTLKFRVKALAAPGTELAKMLQPPAATPMALEGFNPKGQGVFRIRAYDMSKIMDLFSGLYKSLGLDVACFQPLMEQFTGETVAAFSIADKTYFTEGMMALKDSAGPLDDFADQFVQCNQQYLASVAKMAGDSGAMPQITRLPDGQVAGQKTVGFSMEIPVTPAMEGAEPVMANMDIYWAKVDEKFVYASDPARLGNLLELARTLKPQPAKGPVMRGAMDLGAIIAETVSMALPPGEPMPELPGPAVMDFTMDVGQGEATATYTVQKNQMSNLFAALAKMGPQMGAQPGQASAQPYPMDVPPEAESWDPAAGYAPPPLTQEQQIADLQKKGDLAAIYGAPKAAIRSYKKILDLDPDNAEAHFAMATAYGDARMFDQAFAHANRALELAPENADYMYGRARLYLLNGDNVTAVVEFIQAAEAGSDDAQAYLDRMEGR